MPIRLSTIVQMIFSLSNKANSLLLSEFYEYMKSNDVSESHQNNNLKVLIAYARHIRLRELYGEGEIAHESKTGTVPILLTCSFPYVRDWLSEHPFKNEANARLICNLLTAGPIKADALCTVMKQLRKRIVRLLENRTITDEREHQKLALLIRQRNGTIYEQT
jgi:integrase/recombinase XerD